MNAQQEIYSGASAFMYLFPASSPTARHLAMIQSTANGITEPIRRFYCPEAKVARNTILNGRVVLGEIPLPAFALINHTERCHKR